MSAPALADNPVRQSESLRIPTPGPSNVLGSETVLALLVAFLLVWLFWHRFVWMFQLWTSDGLYSFSALVPFASLALAYLKFKRIRDLPRRPKVGGVLLLGTSVLLLLALDGLGAGFYSLTPLLLVFTLSGIILAVCGSKVLRALAFPLGFLLFMVPLPPAVFASFDYPLQIMCAQVTVGLAHAIGIGVQRAGTMLLFPDPAQLVNVAPACNGVRSSLAMLVVAVLYAYLVDARWYRKAALVIAGLPLAYFSNFIRLFANVCLTYTVGPAFMKYEEASDYVFGFFVFGVAVLLLFVIARGIRCNRFREIG